MVNIARDIEVLENLIIAMNEGASDEKYSALNAVERLLTQKKDYLRNFELEMAEQDVHNEIEREEYTL